MATASYVQVQLTPAGVKAAQGGTLTISIGNRALSFTAAEPTKVEQTYEWPWIRDRSLGDGVPLFELVPSAAAPVAAAADASSTPGPVAVAKPTVPAAPAPTVLATIDAGEPKAARASTNMTEIASTTKETPAK